MKQRLFIGQLCGRNGHVWDKGPEWRSHREVLCECVWKHRTDSRLWLRHRAMFMDLNWWYSAGQFNCFICCHKRKHTLLLQNRRLSCQTREPMSSSSSWNQRRDWVKPDKWSCSSLVAISCSMSAALCWHGERWKLLLRQKLFQFLHRKYHFQARSKMCR